jgi:hypothetical protein
MHQPLKLVVTSRGIIIPDHLVAISKRKVNLTIAVANGVTIEITASGIIRTIIGSGMVKIDAGIGEVEAVAAFVADAAADAAEAAAKTPRTKIPRLTTTTGGRCPLDLARLYLTIITTRTMLTKA